MCLLECAAYTHYDSLNPIFLGDVLLKLPFDFLRVL